MKYITLSSRAWWKFCWHSPDSKIGIFRNLPHVMPGRWGFYILGFEVGSRNPRDPVGVWLKAKRLYPW